MLLLLVLSVGGVVDRGSDLRISAHGNGHANCKPKLFSGTPPNNAVYNLRDAITADCQAVTAGQYLQSSGNEYLDAGTPNGTAWVYLQHNSNEYVQAQFSELPCGPNPATPVCFSQDWDPGPPYIVEKWTWYHYWQYNPPNGTGCDCHWKQQVINTYPGGDSWFRSGVLGDDYP